MTITVNAREAFYIKTKSLPIEVKEELLSKYTYRFYEEKACNSCELRPDRHSESCDNCAAYKGGAQLAQNVTLNDKRYLKTPIGDFAGLKKILDSNQLNFDIKPHFPSKEMKRKFKFTGTLKPLQKEAVVAIKKKKRGVIKAPPRSGKTVLAAAAIAALGLKTIIIASQRDWLLGFQETFIGSDTQIPLTTCKPSQIGFAKTYADFLKYDVCLVTIQTFYSEKGQKLLRKIRDLFCVMFVDEVHTSAAPKYAVGIAGLNCRYKIGLSGTPSRKDGRHSIMRALIGPNIYEAKTERIRPHVRLVRTNYVFKGGGNVPWVRMVSSLEKDPARLKLIAEWAIKDAKNGHMVLIPLTQVTPIKALVKAINRIAGRNLAFPFYGGLSKDQRKMYIQKARDFKIKILVGNIKLLSTGINIPRASCLYEVAMSSNNENAEQRFSRVLTPWDDKPTPLIRYFLDNSSVRRRCIANEWYNVLLPIFKPVIQDKDLIAFKSYLANKENSATRMEF